MSAKKILTQIIKYLFVLIFWLVIWHFLSKKINNSIFLPTPRDSILAVLNIFRKDEFLLIVFNSFFRIVKGFVLAVIVGFVLSILSYFIGFIEILIIPVMKLVKTIPVASFVILALLWIDSSNLSVLISFMMVLPIVYINTFYAFKGVDKKMLEMAKVFEVSHYRKIRFIYVPEIFPAFISACKIGLGFSFKAGIAAEIIGLPSKSIGWELYQSKLYLMTDEMFAWTIIIILISIFFEVVCIYLLNRLLKYVMRVNVKEKNIIKKYVTNNDLEKIDDKDERKLEELEKKLINNGFVKGYKIKLENINKSYGKNVVLKDVNVCFDNNLPVCIMGESGVGKTTLIKIILGLIKQYKGSIKVECKDCNEDVINSFEMANSIKMAAVFQEDRLFEELDVYTNIYAILGDEVSKDEIDTHLALLGLKGLGDKKIKEFSGGMKRRVEIMRAILSGADMYIFDEAFKGLDDKNSDIVIEYVKKYTLRKILVIVSHNIYESEKFGAKVVKL